MNNELINDLQLIGFEVSEKDGVLRMEGDSFIIEYEFKQYWLYSKNEDGTIYCYIDQFDSLDEAFEASKLVY